MYNSISKAAKLQLIGLITLSQHHMRQAEECHKAAKQLIGVVDSDEDFGHLDDAIYTSYDTDVTALLGRLKITVK